MTKYIYLLGEYGHRYAVARAHIAYVHFHKREADPAERAEIHFVGGGSLLLPMSAVLELERELESK